MPKKQKSESCTSGWCRSHVFELNPLSKGLFFKKAQKMRLCPYFNINLNNFSKSIPVLNRDNKFYTPNFILESQQKFYYENCSRFLFKHLEKVQENQSEKSEIVIIFGDLEQIGLFDNLVPRHSTSRNYCSVCQKQFDDYLEHIESQTHKRILNRSRYTGFVRELESKYRKAGNKCPKRSTNHRRAQMEETNELNIQVEGVMPKAQFSDKSSLQYENL